MMKRMNKKAFTLIELLVVIAVVGILVLLAAPRFTGYTQKAEDARIQHDIKVMEQEVGTVLINGEDDFNKWENNSKDYLNQLAQDNELFEKEGTVVANDGEPIDGSYKIIPEKYKDKINTKLKGTFYANSDGKVYYEHGKGPGYSDEEIDDLINNCDFIPIADADELNNVRYKRIETYGKGTKWERECEGGLDKHYVQVKDIDLSEYSEDGWDPIGTCAEYNDSEPFTGIYDGGNYVIRGLEIKGPSGREEGRGLFGHTDGAVISNVGLIDNKVAGFQYVGGLVGFAYNSTITNSYATGEVEGGQWVGGLVGRLTSSTIENSHATGLIKGRNGNGITMGHGNSMGGLVGLADTSWNLGDTDISNSYFIGSVETATGTELGGLVGSVSYNSKISNSYAEGSVKGEGELGGLVGGTSGTIENSYFIGEVTGTGRAAIRGHIYVGGLVGVAGNSTKIENSYVEGSVTATGKSIKNGNTDTVYVGGLVGHNGRKNNISNSYFTGSVTGTGTGTVPIYAGGLVGFAKYARTTISNSYSTGSVTGTGTGKGTIYAGGLVGRAYAGNEDASIVTIDNSYATGPVTVTGSGTQRAGGLVGSGDSIPININNSYWDINTTGQTSSHGQDESFGKTTEDMKSKATYSGWNFTNIWEITPGNYPTLR